MQWKCLQEVRKYYERYLLRRRKGNIFNLNKVKKLTTLEEQLLMSYLSEHYGYYFSNIHCPIDAKQFHKSSYSIRYELLIEHNESHYLLIRSLNNIGYCLRQLNKFEESKSRYEEALRLAKNSGLKETNFHYYGRLYFNEAISGREIGDEKIEVEELFKKVIELRKKYYGDEHRYVGKAILNLGIFYRQKGDITEATRLFTEAKKNIS